MKRLLITVVSCFLIAGNAWGVDDAAVQEVDAKATSANNKADTNNGRIQAVEADIVALSEQINTIKLMPGPAGADGATGPAGPQGPDGATGPAGPQGLSCWDLNENGLGDLEEDVTGDGIVNAADCQATVDQSALYEKIMALENRLSKTDFDGDGGLPPIDCDDADPTRSGHLTEIPADGIDNDCDNFVDNISTTSDYDGDGLTDALELELGCEWNRPDTDSDSLSQSSRQVYAGERCESYSCGTWGMSTCTRCYPIYHYETLPAVDMNDYLEVTVYGTNCNDRDTDDDGFSDGLEIRNRTDPLTPQ